MAGKLGEYEINSIGGGISARAELGALPKRARWQAMATLHKIEAMLNQGNGEQAVDIEEMLATIKEATKHPVDRNGRGGVRGATMNHFSAGKK